MDPGISGSAPFAARGEADTGPLDDRSGRAPDWLVRTLETRVVPALLSDRAAGARRAPRPRAAPPSAPPGEADVGVLLGLLRDGDGEGCEALVGALRDEGVGVEVLCTDLIAPAARRLGQDWDEDRCDFVTVTEGLWRLQTLVHLIGADAPPPEPVPGAGRLLLAAVPGCAHLLGAVMVAAAFRRAGWFVIFEAGASAACLRAAVQADIVDVIGLCIGQDREFDAARALIPDLRRASRNAGVRVLVGGPAFAGRSTRATGLGADTWAHDAASAVAAASAQLREARAAARWRARTARVSAAPPNRLAHGLPSRPPVGAPQRTRPPA